MVTIVLVSTVLVIVKVPEDQEGGARGHPGGDELVKGELPDIGVGVARDDKIPYALWYPPHQIRLDPLDRRDCIGGGCAGLCGCQCGGGDVDGCDPASLVQRARSLRLPFHSLRPRRCLGASARSRSPDKGGQGAFEHRSM